MGQMKKRLLIQSGQAETDRVFNSSPENQTSSLLSSSRHRGYFGPVVYCFQTRDPHVVDPEDSNVTLGEGRKKGAISLQRFNPLVGTSSMLVLQV
jgi:hypothetical protein